MLVHHFVRSIARSLTLDTPYQDSTDTSEPLTLEYLLTIWPIVESLATQLPVGDLITLARTSRNLRATLHGSVPDRHRRHRDRTDGPSRYLEPVVGHHQTTHWTHLKALSPFVCVNKVHTKGNQTKPCVYCSRPICDACIVRDSFQRGKQDIFKNRLRYLCRSCWMDGKETKCHRYIDFAGQSNYDSLARASRFSDDSSRTKGIYCSCRLSDNAWLCIECKDWQNSSVYGKPGTEQSHPPQVVQCHALGCEKLVHLGCPENERYKVCLWCEKPCERQFTSEDRFAWEQKALEARAKAAEARNRNIENYMRRHWRSLRMSRNEMRGTSENTRDDKLELVRHLDATNYRNIRSLREAECPSPEAVYNSKNGTWRYSITFLLAFKRRCMVSSFKPPSELNTEELRRVTSDDALQHARTNLMHFNDLKEMTANFTKLQWFGTTFTHFNTIQARLWDRVLQQDREVPPLEISGYLEDVYGIRLVDKVVEKLLGERLQQRREELRRKDESDAYTTDGSITLCNSAEEEEDDDDDSKYDADQDQDTDKENSATNRKKKPKLATHANDDQKIMLSDDELDIINGIRHGDHQGSITSKLESDSQT